MHLHQLVLNVPVDNRVTCEGCDLRFRLATRDEALFVQMTDMYLDDGPLLCNNGVVVVPLTFSLYLPTGGTHADSP